ncbi:MAG: 4-phosphopantoate--beta-alanine ligase [Candidatus Helarchaeota archaeon]
MSKLGEEPLPSEIPEDHPRAESLRVRHKITEGLDKNVVAKAGLIAHGRGEAFDYLIGEITCEPAKKAIKAACAALLLAKHPIISVNGNVAALTPKDVVILSKESGAKLEINLFYRTKERENALENALKAAGADDILGIGLKKIEIEGLSSKRRIVDPEGIAKADVVLVPLEDGDRTEALVRARKKVIAIDLNPLSRTAQHADITIVDNLIRCLPLMIDEIKILKSKSKIEIEKLLKNFDNKKNLTLMIELIGSRFLDLAKKEKNIPGVKDL